LDYRGNFRRFKFQQEHLRLEHDRIKLYLENESLGVRREQYLEICKVTGSPVEEDKIPPEFEDFTDEAQTAMVITNRLPDNWDYTSGYYIGKDLTILPYLFKIYELDDEEMMLDLIFTVIKISSDITNEKVKQQQKVKKRV